MENTLAIDFAAAPNPPIPHTLQYVFLCITIVLSAAVTIAAAMISRRRKSAAPLLLVLGGFAAILMEPVVTFLGHAVHPKIGQIMMFEAVGRAIPWHVALGYMAAFGVFYLILYSRLVSGAINAKLVWKVTIITVLCYYVGEAYPVEHGLWVYYGYQPLWFWRGTAPPTWSVLNATSMLTSATLMLIALPYLKGVAQLLLVPLAISGAYMGHMGAGFPMYTAMNADVPHWVMDLSGVASIGMALLIVWICALLLTPSGPRPAW